MTLEFLFEQFCKERLHIKNSRAHTIAFYRRSFKTYQKVMSGSAVYSDRESTEALPTKHILKSFVTGIGKPASSPQPATRTSGDPLLRATSIQRQAGLCTGGQNGLMRWKHQSVPDSFRV
jgi:hypothetical protein